MKTDFFDTTFFEGKFTHFKDANISVATNALQYGTAIFGGIRGYYNKKGNFVSIFRVDDHIKRSMNALKILGTSTKYTHEEIKKIMVDLVKKNKPQTDFYMRPFLYAAGMSLSPNLHDHPEFEFTIYMLPLGEYISIDKGVSVMVSSWRRISDNAIPSRAKIAGGYINSSLAKKEAVERGFDEAIFLMEDGHVAEGSAMNLFLVRDGVLVSPSSSSEILEGITRRSIFKIAEDLGIPTEMRTVDRSELYIADEAFFSGTGAQVSWISKVDGRLIGEGKKGNITSQIADVFYKAVKADYPKYKNWNTIIKI